MNAETKCADDILVECDLPHSPEKVWQAITDEDLLGQWLASSDLRPEVGARFRLPPSGAVADAPMIDCEVIEAVPGRTLRWRQTERTSADEPSSIESTVTFELLPIPDGTHLRIVHDQFREISTEIRASSSNVIRFAPRASSAKRVASRTTTIVCVLGTLRRAA